MDDNQNVGSRLLSSRTIRRHAAAHAGHILMEIHSGLEDSENGEDTLSDINSSRDIKESDDDRSSTCMESDDNEATGICNDDVNESSEDVDLLSSEDDISDTDDEGQPDIRDQIKEWVLESNTPLCHTNSLLAMLRPHFPSLPIDARTLLQTRRNYNVEDMAGGRYHHFGIAEGIKARLQRLDHLRALDEVSLQVNIDGLPLFKSSSESFWPILGLVLQEEKPEPFIMGLWVGVSKPSDANIFMSKFVDEMKEIEIAGICYAEKVYTVRIVNFVCDTPARAFVKKTKGHTGYYGCDYCIQTGEWFNHRMTFPERSAPSRSDISFDEMQNEEHHNGETSLRNLHIGLVTQFPLDYMHLVCLGVMKKCLSLWMNGPLNVRVGSNVVRRISEAIMSLKGYLPREFVRKGRGLNEVERWKATEFRTFLLYTGPVALKGKISDVMYSNFMMLVVAITILASPIFCSVHCDYAEILLGLFFDHFSALYGQQNVIYNVHALTHLASHARRFGPLHKFSAFPFENFLQSIKKLVRKPTSFPYKFSR